ncbi:MAG TPA: S8 family serine peptidase [Verrucomicrobiae bacterium]|nr:S8 family serine peptidase [Verrucomicrobiae bacterium]
MSVQSGRLVCFAVCALTAAGQLSAQTPSERLCFRLPQRREFRFESKLSQLQPAASRPHWLRAWAMDGSTNSVEFGDRVVLQLQPGASLDSVVRGQSLKLSRTVSSNVFILQAPNAVVAALEASRLSAAPGVAAGYPIIRQEVSLDGLYAARPNDPHFPPQLGTTIGQWNQENRDVTNGAVLGPDLNVRGAWPYTRGEGVTIAIADTGIEISHRELTNAAAGAPHLNFADLSNDPTPTQFTNSSWAHGTECAGLAVAAANNAFGMAGVAPGAKVAGWVIFTNDSPRLVSDERLHDMFVYASNVVGVQSHSWTHPGRRQRGLTTLENLGIESAVSDGRFGRGAVLLRPSGNDREILANANDDAYCSDPRVITVGAVNRTGRTTVYSERGACLLLAAPSGADVNSSGLFTTDLLGPRGRNAISFFPPFEYLSDFVYNSLGFTGSSTGPPQIAGVTALLLSVNTNLTYRDVQQVLLLSARHFDPGDPDVLPNGAGLLVGHNDGYGVPDAGQAVKLARQWVNRPAATNISVIATGPLSIPDDGLRLLITGDGVPPELASIRCLPSAGPHPDDPTPLAPLVDLGLATNTVQIDLTGKAALIERGTNNFDEKILRAAAAGAEFAVIYNFATNTDFGCPGGEQLCLMGATDFVPIPAIFIGRSNGLALQGLFSTNSAARAQLRLNSVSIPLTVTDTLICEHIGVRVQTDHTLRGDVRITLVSPAGTRSVLQHYNGDPSAGPVDWTYWSTHHFYEPSAGQWRVEVGDEFLGATGSVQALSLLVTGIPISDSDGDGLDDDWEMSMFGNLLSNAQDDPDDDGYNNAMEQAMSTDPMVPNEAFRLDLMIWSTSLARLSWPGRTGRTYDVLAGANPAGLTLLTNVPGRFPETECFTTTTNNASRFFRVREVLP